MSMPRNAMHPNLQEFRVLMSPKTHRQRATCAEVDCPQYLGGWLTVVAVGSLQDDYIRNRSGREWTVTKVGDSQLEYRFPAGQRCFDSDQHTRLNGREPFYVHETAERRLVHRPKDFIEHAKEEIERQFADKEGWTDVIPS